MITPGEYAERNRRAEASLWPDLADWLDRANVPVDLRNELIDLVDRFQSQGFDRAIIMMKQS